MPKNSKFSNFSEFLLDPTIDLKLKHGQLKCKGGRHKKVVLGKRSNGSQKNSQPGIDAPIKKEVIHFEVKNKIAVENSKSAVKSKFKNLKSLEKKTLCLNQSVMKMNANIV